MSRSQPAKSSQKKPYTNNVIRTIDYIVYPMDSRLKSIERQNPEKDIWKVDPRREQRVNKMDEDSIKKLVFISSTFMLILGGCIMLWLLFHR